MRSTSTIRRTASYHAEFDDWRWERLDRTPDLVVPFKREVYAAVAKGFASLAKPEQG